MLKPIADKKIFIKNFFKKFNLLKEVNPQLDNFLKALPAKTAVYVIGGFLRYVGDKSYKTKDVDIIIAISSDEVFDKIIKNSFTKIKKNKMGGFKIKLKNITLDIWSLKNHYGFKRNVAKTEIEAIAKSSFYNFDSIVFDVKNRKLCCKYYNLCLKTGILDLMIN